MESGRGGEGRGRVGEGRGRVIRRIIRGGQENGKTEGSVTARPYICDSDSVSGSLCAFSTAS